LKTLFVNPNNRNPLGDVAAIEPPLWLSLMAAHYIEDGKDVSVLDAEAENLTSTETVAAVLESHPDEVVIVVMGNNPSVSSTPKMTVSVELETLLRPHFKRLYLTGLHPMAVGGENVLHWRPTKLLPLPWHLLDMSLYRAHNWHCMDGSPRKPYASIYTSLGCCFDCYYCNIHTLYQGRQMMYRRPANVVLEVNDLVTKYGVRNIKIWDEMFALNESRVIQLCQALQMYDLNMWAYARVDTVTEPMLHAMKRAGINWVAYGFENASSEVRESSNKRFSESKVERAIKMTREAGINIIGNFTFGLPGETLQSAKATLAFAKQHLFEFVNFYEALPYPGSKWFEDTKPTLSYKQFDQYATFKEEDSMAKMPRSWSTFRVLAFKEYVKNPAYLAMVQEKFGDAGTQMVRNLVVRSGKVGVT